MPNGKVERRLGRIQLGRRSGRVVAEAERMVMTL